ncbi:MAG: carboxylating nicotinate-nucleotide diphosphorylase [Verrucomicrobiota bacterium]
MSIESLEPSIVHEAAARALGEDRGPLDITSEATIPPNLKTKARIFCKEQGVLCGVVIARAVFHEVDPSLNVEIVKADASSMAKNDTVMTIKGNAKSITVGERAALNFLQHLSGIATKTARYVTALGEGASTQILDTRKTVPGMRALQKYAVRCGGGLNHRKGLYDEFMIKDNHFAMAALNGWNIEQVIGEAKRFDPDRKLTVEADTLAQVEVIAELGVDQILLDNMSNEEMRMAVELVAGKAKLEASGNITLERVPEVAATGVDYISVGALTHTIKALDFSLETSWS